MRVLLVSNMYATARHPKWGSFVVDMEAAMAARGVEVRRAVNTVPGKNGLVVAAKYAILLCKCLWAAARGGFDAVHAHYLFPTGYLARLAARARRVPLVLFSHGSDVLLADWAWPVGSMTRRTVADADLVVAPSEHHAAVVRETFGLARDRVVRVPMPVDLARFRPGSRQAARDAAALPQDGAVALFVGALDDNKGEGCEELVRALRAPALGEVTLLIVGEGPREARVRDLVEREGMADRVRMGPFVGRGALVGLMRAADVVVMPSRREALGLVVLEALAVGTPVVASRAGALPDHVVPGVNGELYDAGDEEGLARAIATALEASAQGRYDVALDAAFGPEAVGRELVAATERVIREQG